MAVNTPMAINSETSVPPISDRKRDHIAINLHEDVQPRSTTTGFDQYRFVHNALPDLDFDAVQTETTFLGHRLEMPLLISSMTGGTPDATRINRRLAEAAEATGCAMAVGSQRSALEHEELIPTFCIRKYAPSVPLFANLGAVQLNYGYGIDACRRAIDMIRADGLILHVNAMQEVLQSSGNHNFNGLLHKIEAMCHALEAPVIVKEVGFGLSTSVARQLRDAGVAAIDVSGAGGTSWSAVEGYRAESPERQRIAETFRDWGIPTAWSLRTIRAEERFVPLIASGGMLTGLDIAKAIAFGANLAGIAGPLLRAAVSGERGAIDLIQTIREELRITMFCTGSATLGNLPNTMLFADSTGNGAMPRLIQGVPSQESGA